LDTVNQGGIIPISSGEAFLVQQFTNKLLTQIMKKKKALSFLNIL